MKLPSQKNFDPGIAPMDRPGLPTAFYKCRRDNNAPEGHQWIAWAALLPMTDASVIMEPAEPLWFDFGATEAEAIAKVKTEVEREIGKAEWQRQVA